MSEPCDLTAVEARRLIAEKALSPVELLESCIRRIEAVEFAVKNDDGAEREVVREFDMLHVCPPQIAPDVLRGSPIADAGGWVDVDQESLRHKKYKNVFGLGDACNAPNAKTAAAARKQAPIVAENLLAVMKGGAVQGTIDRVELDFGAFFAIDRRHEAIVAVHAPSREMAKPLMSVSASTWGAASPTRER